MNASECTICGKTIQHETYDDFKCPKCGQEFIWDEGHQIVLTDSQMELLRAAYRQQVIEAAINHANNVQ